MDLRDLDREYNGHQRWPFFAVRIPLLQNPHVREKLTEERVSENDVAGLLRLFIGFCLT